MVVTSGAEDILEGERAQEALWWTFQEKKELKTQCLLRLQFVFFLNKLPL